MKDVAAVLEVNESLRELRISGYEISESDSVILAHSLRKNRTLERLAEWLNTLPGWMEEFVWSLRDCHLKTLTVLWIQGRGVSSQLVDRVNEVRRKQGLPLLKDEYY